MNRQKKDLLIRCLLGWFLPPVGVLLTLNKQNTPNWRNWYFNIFLTVLFWIPGSIHAVWFIVDTELKPRHNTGSPDIQLRDTLQFFQIIVSIIIPIATLILTWFSLLIAFENSQNQRQIFSSIPLTAKYTCNYKTERKRIYNIGKANLRITPEKSNEDNVIETLTVKQNLIIFSSNGEWRYICVEGTKKYGWINLQVVKE